MVTLPGDDFLFEHGEDPESTSWVPDGLCVAAGEYWGSTVMFGTVRQRDAMLTEYLDWAEAGRPRHPDGRPAWPPPEEPIEKVAERNRSLAARAIHAATGLFVKVPERYPRKPETVEAPPSFDEDGSEWVSLPGIASTTPVDAPGRLGSHEVAPDSTPVTKETPEKGLDPEAGRFSREHDLPRHNKNRPSNTPEGRRKRFIRLMAEREGTTIKQAEKNHPARPRKPTSEE